MGEAAGTLLAIQVDGGFALGLATRSIEKHGTWIWVSTDILADAGGVKDLSLASLLLAVSAYRGEQKVVRIFEKFGVDDSTKVGKWVLGTMRLKGVGVVKLADEALDC